MMELAPSLAVQLVSCTAACVGFAYWFNVKGIQILYSGIGAFFTWLVYALLFNAGYSNFLATLVGSIFVAAYAQVMARVNKAPATIFQTVCVFPLVPGPNLYYMMYGIVMEMHEVARSEAVTLVVTCLGIALGFIVIEIINKYINRMIARLRK
jgi:uncharacterized membrane protein YjjB (DUF3815 family)